MLRRAILALCALLVATAAGAQQYRPGYAPGFRPGFQFINGAGGFPASGAVVDYDFRGDRYSGPPISVTRASAAYIDDSAGNWTLVPANMLRRSDKGALIEGAQTNSIRNNSMQGAAVGTPGTLPTNWSSSQSNGLTPQVVGTGAENGIDYIDIRLAGTATAGVTNLVFDTATAAAAASGQLWAISFFAKIGAGSLTNITNVRAAIQENSSGGAFVAAGSADQMLAAGSLGSSRKFYSRTLSGGGTVAAVSGLLQVVATAGAVDITLRIGWPQLEQWSTGVTTVGGASSPIRTTGTAATRAADVVTATLAGLGTAFSVATVFTPSSLSAANGTTFNVSDGTLNNRAKLFRTGATVLAEVNAAGVAQVGVQSPVTIGARTAVSTAYATNEVALSVNGAAVATSPNGLAAVTYTKLNIGSHAGNGFQPFEYIERLAIWPTRLSNAQLQTYSTLATWGG